MSEGETTAGEITHWDQLPLILTMQHMAAIYSASPKTISRWSGSGHIPKPLLKSGRILRWDREEVRKHLAARRGSG